MMFGPHFLISSLFTLAISANVILPSPSGPYAVTQNTLKLTDESRVDSLDPKHGKRQIMVSSFYPVKSSACEKPCEIPYMSPNAAPIVEAFLGPFGIQGGALGKIRMQGCCKATCQESNGNGEIPLVFLLHGFGGTRLLHNALAQELASMGFAIITMDHTFESVLVEFPDGTVIRPLNDSSLDTTIPGRLESLQDIRVDDARFVMSQLGSKDVVAKLVPDSRCTFNAERAAVIGHSVGGSTSMKLLMKDLRFVGGLNLDGEQFGEITDMQQPAVLFGTTGVTPVPHNSTSDPSWAKTLDHLKGWKREIGLNNISHTGFTDISFLVGTGALDIPKEAADQFIGILDGKRSFEIFSTYVAAFLDFVLRGGKTALFDGPSEKFPEIVVL
ncbi:PAF acetylhydrolase family protein [Massariosphaeria phaeospora]|uniref:1-alkyl-2-acetylglycerophosphocholine esterase n=1 Tax=Massariosphaeria phaeospora TaxID=100035 RepID=A0A7C8M341_9PLEO|nr:PAF acetylhydrolase family protein [Massariosphaeria phaeospora]